MRCSFLGVAALALALPPALSAQIVGAGSAALGRGTSTSSVRAAATTTHGTMVGAGTAAMTAGHQSATVPSVGLSSGGDTGSSGVLGRSPQALGTTPTLSERIDAQAGVPSTRIGERVGAAPGFSVMPSDSNRMQAQAMNMPSALDSAGRPVGSPLGPDRVQKTVPGALDHDDDPLTPQ